MRLLIDTGLTGAAIVVLLAGVAARAPRQPTASRPVVVAELFTSEGCSSCPPADALLRQLAEGTTPDGLDVIALGEHVDYWDRLGWRDPFSSPVFSRRQSEYDAAVFHSRGSYTPQLVVDGALQAAGNDAASIRRALVESARTPKVAVALTAGAVENGRLRIELHVDVPDALMSRGSSDLLVAITEDGLVTHVQRGENGGRTLQHAAVVRSLTTIGTLSAGQRSWSGPAMIPVKTEWQASRLRVVGFMQDRVSRRILGGAAVSPKAS